MIKKIKSTEERMTEVLCISINPRILEEAHSQKTHIKAMLIRDFRICFYPDTNGQMRIQKIHTESENYVVLGKTTMFYWLAKDIECYLRHKGSVVKHSAHIWVLAQTNGHFDPQLAHH